MTNKDWIMRFLRVWLKHAHANTPNKVSFFDPSKGLCKNLANYLDDRNMGYYRKLEVKADFMVMLQTTAGGSGYPFNMAPMPLYAWEEDNECIHKNPQRLGWVIKTLAKEKQKCLLK